MAQKKSNSLRAGIAYRTAIVTGIVILLFLSCTTAIFIYMESRLVDLSIREYARSADQLINKRTDAERQSLEQSLRIFSEIFSNSASVPLYNFDSDSLSTSLMAYMKIPAIKAVQVDSAFGSFKAAWKDDGINTGNSIPEDFVLDGNSSLTQDINHEVRGKQEKVGQVNVYYTQEFMTKRIGEEKAFANSQLVSFNTVLTEKFNQLLIYQLAFIIVAIILLFFTTNLTLKLNAVRPIRRIIHGIQNGINQLTIGTGSITQGSRSIAHDVSNQAGAIQEIAATLEELSNNTRQNANSAHSADELMHQADQVVKKTSISIEQLTQCMNDICTAGKNTQKIVKTIDEIAFQTNLLALNAAVEAARAGESGTGFAVVADEVRNLAVRAAEATSNTADLIDSTSRKVSQGIELVETTNKDFTEVGDNAARMSQLIAQISTASAQQSDGVDQINRAMAELDKITQQNAAAAEESASATEELNSQTAALDDIVHDLTALVGGRNRIGRKAAHKTSSRLLLQPTQADGAGLSDLPTDRDI
jgi:uncharacterized protein YoxC